MNVRKDQALANAIEHVEAATKALQTAQQALDGVRGTARHFDTLKRTERRLDAVADMLWEGRFYEIAEPLK